MKTTDKVDAIMDLAWLLQKDSRSATDLKVMRRAVNALGVPKERWKELAIRLGYADENGNAYPLIPYGGSRNTKAPDPKLVFWK